MGSFKSHAQGKIQLVRKHRPVANMLFDQACILPRPIACEMPKLQIGNLGFGCTF